MAVILAAAIIIVGCKPTPEDARKELTAFGVEYTPEKFVQSAQNNDLRAVELFLLAGIDVNVTAALPSSSIQITDKIERLPYVGPALHVAIGNRHQEVVAALIAASADVNMKARYFAAPSSPFSDELAPLSIAILTGDDRVIVALIAAGADVSRKDYLGTPLFLAASGGHKEVVAILKAAGARR